MALRAINDIVVINRGDSFDLDFIINDPESDSNEYVMSGNDAVYFGLMDPHQPFEYALVRKKYTAADLDEEGILTIEIKPEDTLDLVPGVYYYQIKLLMDHDEQDEEGNITHVNRVATVINKTKFIICE